MAPTIDVLVPTCARPPALALTLAGVAAQDYGPLRVLVSDQSPEAVRGHPEVKAVQRLLKAQGRPCHILRHLPRRGMAEQRAFLLDQAEASYCWFLDDDVLTETDLLSRMVEVLMREACGFVGSAPHGLSFCGDERPGQEAISFWNGPVEPELVWPDSPAWARHHLHSAANLYHAQQRLGTQGTRIYKVAWVGACVLFDTAKLRAAGGFDFWPRLPEQHCGEDVLAQLRLMARSGGCAIFPSGAYHMELPTTLPQRDCDAARLLWRAA